nr:hypothetical protein [Fischerella sp. PCC 9605]
MREATPPITLNPINPREFYFLSDIETHCLSSSLTALIALNVLPSVLDSYAKWQHLLKKLKLQLWEAPA